MLSYDATSILEISSVAMIIVGAITFVACMTINAPYGRYSAKSGWGFLVPAQIAWLVMESPNLWMPVVVKYYIFPIAPENDPIERWPNRLLLGLFIMHYVHRSIIYPLFRVSGARHQSMPVSVMLLAFLYCCWNGFNQSLALLVVNNYPEDWFMNPKHLIGLFIFFLGFLVNIQSDSILLSLKDNSSSNSNRKSSTDKTHYKIPTGGMFRFVSCANYFGEIVEWLGFAIACWSLPAAAFALYTFCNIGPRGYQHHQWYRQKFENYPRERKAVIPFIW